VNGLDDRVNGFDQCLADLVTGGCHDLGNSGDEITSLDVHDLCLRIDGGRGDGELDLLGRTLADQHVVLTLDVVDDRLVHLVTAGTDRTRRDDA